jgi:hypothetical protein
VLTAIRRAGNPKVMTADDVLRYDEASLRVLHSRLDPGSVAIPQNHFVRTSRHASGAASCRRTT